MGATSVADVFYYGGTILEFLLAVRLSVLGLGGRYPVLWGYLCFEVARGCSLAYLRYTGLRLGGRNGYSLVYLLTQPVEWTLYFLLILELYSLMLDDFPGIRRLSRLVMFSALAAVALAIGAVIVLDEQAGLDHYPFISYLILQHRSVFMCLSALTLLLLLFVAHYRLPIRRNVWVCYASFGGFFVANGIVFTVRRSLGDVFHQSMNLIQSLLYLSALLGPVLFLSKAGESDARSVRPVWSTGDQELEAALSSQLRGFNQLLLKVLRQ